MKVICIVGPTGVGKTKMSLELAKILNGEIINADSTQVYRTLDIATAKVVDQQGIKHHLIDIKNIDEDYSVYDFQQEARNKIAEIQAKNKTPIVVGGTGLYLKALFYNYDLKEEVKKNNDYEKHTNEQLYEQLLKVDSETLIHKNNRKRVIRALEYYDYYKVPFSKKKSNDKLMYDVVFIGLTTNKEKLYEVINNRVDEMLAVGLIKEAKMIYDSKIRTKAVETPIGYKELFPYFENKNSLEESVLKIKQHTRNYAKRQYTWFNNKMDINWFDVNYDDFNKTINDVLDFIKKA